jgi:hypothetical protein
VKKNIPLHLVNDDTHADALAGILTQQQVDHLRHPIPSTPC